MAVRTLCRSYMGSNGLSSVKYVSMKISRKARGGRQDGWSSYWGKSNSGGLSLASLWKSALSLAIWACSTEPEVEGASIDNPGLFDGGNDKANWSPAA